MSQPVLLKRTSTPSKVPLTSDLSLGEIGINTYDGKIFIKKNNGADSIVEIGAGGGGGVASTLDQLTDVVVTAPSADQIIKFNGTNWVNAAAGEVTTNFDCGSALTSDTNFIDCGHANAV